MTGYSDIYRTMHNQAHRKRRRKPKTVVAKEAGFSIRAKGNGFIVQVRREGIRETRSFATLDAAKIHCRSLDTKRINEGLAGFSLTPAQRDDAVNALKLLEGRANLSAAAHAWLRLNPSTDAVTVAALIAQHLADLTNRNRRPRTVEVRRQSLNRFAKDYGTRSAGSITPDEVEGWLKARITEKSFNTMRFCLGAAYSFGVRQRLVEINPIRAIMPKQFDHPEPHFWSVATVASIMHQAAARDKRAASQQAKMTIPGEMWRPITPCFALTAFGGLRPNEVARLDWSSINLEGKIIRVPATVSKTRRARIVPMQKNLIAWLLPYRQNAGPIAPSPITVKRARKAILKKAKLPSKWPQDVLRHSFATYWMAVNAHEGQLAEMMGNSPAIVQRHYKGLTTKREGRKYFAIAPTHKGEIVEMRAAS